MEREKVRAIAVAFLATLVFCVVAYALTTDQIWNAVYDSVTHSLKVVVTP